jgi:hypothetical protein
MHRVVPSTHGVGTTALARACCNIAMHRVVPSTHGVGTTALARACCNETSCPDEGLMLLYDQQQS